MADHLKLPAIWEFHSKRKPPGREGTEFDDKSHATSLRGVLEGLEAVSPGIFSDPGPGPDSTRGPEDDSGDRPGRVVLKFESSASIDGMGIFTHAKMTPLGTTGSREFFALSDRESRVLFKKLVDDYAGDPDGFSHPEAWKKVLRKVSGVSLYDAADRRAGNLEPPEQDDVATFEVALWPTSLGMRSAQRYADERLAEVVQLVESHTERNSQISVLISDPRPDTLSLRLRSDAVLLDELLEHSLIERIYPPMNLTLESSELAAGPVPTIAPVPQGAPIGIIDDLVITSNPWLTGVVTKTKDFLVGPATATGHGNLTAGVAAYGSLLPAVKGEAVPNPHPIYAARILCADSNGSPAVGGDVASLLEEAIKWLAGEGAKIIVCPFARNVADDGPLPDRLSAVVDELARTLDLVIVASTGNVDDIGSAHWLTDYPSYLAAPEAKVASPATAALALAVSSTATEHTLDTNLWPYAKAIAQSRQVSPFSRTGPSRGAGPAGTRKPEFTAPGGNFAWDGSTERVLKTDHNLGILSLSTGSHGRYFEVAAGTSLAAPHVAHEAAKIATRYPDAGANLIRALTALSGIHPNGSEAGDDTIIASEYGAPWADRILESGHNRAIIVNEYEMDTGSSAAIRIPIPVEFATGASHRRFRVSLAFDPPVKRSRKDYIAGRMEFDFLRNVPLGELQSIFQAQPTSEQIKENPKLQRFEKPKYSRVRPQMEPNITSLKANTLVVRQYETPHAGWEPDDHDYHLVVTHTRSSWSAAQQQEYSRQRFAVAIELIDISRTDLQLHNLVSLELRPRLRQRI